MIVRLIGSRRFLIVQCHQSDVAQKFSFDLYNAFRIISEGISLTDLPIDLLGEDWAVRREMIAQRKLYEAEAEVEARNWEKKNSDFSFQEINQEYESQRFQLHSVQGFWRLSQSFRECKVCASISLFPFDSEPKIVAATDSLFEVVPVSWGLVDLTHDMHPVSRD